jgi:hypothetical protein
LHHVPLRSSTMLLLISRIAIAVFFMFLMLLVFGIGCNVDIIMHLI